jgi:hypothetical protein
MTTVRRRKTSAAGGDSEPDISGTAEFTKIRAVMRASEKYRKGGMDLELEDADADPGPNT